VRLVDDELQEILTVAAELQALSGAFAQGQSALREDTEGTDTRNAITVVLDGDGRVSAVRPSTRWSEAVPPEALGTAVLEAVQSAQGRRLERWAERAKDTADRTPAPPPQPPPSAQDAAPVNILGLVGELVSMFDTLELFAGGRSEGSGPVADTPVEHAGRVDVTLSPTGQPAQVWVEPRWAASVSRTGLSERILDAFEKAYDDHDARRSTGQAGFAPTMSPGMSALAADPGGVLARFMADVQADLRPPSDSSYQPGRQ
jgi:DNA-binding protein YbaB